MGGATPPSVAECAPIRHADARLYACAARFPAMTTAPPTLAWPFDCLGCRRPLQSGALRRASARDLHFSTSAPRPETPAHTDGELARNFLCGGRSCVRDATVDSVAHPSTGALLQGVRPFLPHCPETRLVAGFFASHHSIVVALRAAIAGQCFVQPDGPPAGQCLL